MRRRRRTEALLGYPASRKFQGVFRSELVEKGFRRCSGPSGQLIAGGIKDPALIQLFSQT